MLILISQVCVISHNILVSLRIRGELDDEGDNDGPFIPREEFMDEFASIVHNRSRNKFEGTENFDEIPSNKSHGLDMLQENNDAVASESRHRELLKALIYHFWTRRGSLDSFT
jgi:hypothetical protein